MKVDVQLAFAMNEAQSLPMKKAGPGAGVLPAISAHNGKTVWSILHRVSPARLVGSGYTSVEVELACPE